MSSYVWDEEPVPDEIRSGGSLTTRSTTAPASPFSSPKKRYVWDENDANEFVPPSDVLQQVAVHTYSDTDQKGVSNADTVVLIASLKEKKETLHKELDGKIQEARSLHMEYARLNTAVQRKEEKTKVIWEARLQKTKEEHDASIKNQKDFNEKLSVDLKQLRDKKAALLERGRVYDDERRSEVLATAKKEAGAKYIRVRRQWEIDEKKVFEKMATLKSETIRKQVADSFGPELDRLVSEGKEEVRRMSAEAELQLAQLRRTLDSEYEKRVAEERQKLEKQTQVDMERMRRQHDRIVEDFRQKSTHEFKERRDKYLRRIALAEEEAEKIQRQDADVTSNAIREIHKVEAEQLAAALSRHQKDVAEEARRGQEALEQAERQMKQRQEAWAQKRAQVVARRRQEERERIRLTAAARVAEEEQQVLSRLAEEIARERKTKEDELKKSLEHMRMRCQVRLQDATEAEHRALQNEVALREEMKNLRGEKLQLSSQLRKFENELESCATRDADLRAEVHRLEAEIAKETLHCDNDGNDDGDDQRLADIAEEEGALKVELRAKQQQRETRLQGLWREQEAEISRVRSKIKILLERKESTKAQLVRQLAEVRAAIADAENRVAAGRLARYGGTGGRTDKAERGES